MVLMRRKVGIYVVALCVVLQACGTAQDPKPGSEATAGNAGQGGSAGSTNGGSAGQTASIGGRNDESIGFGGVADEPGDGTAGTDAGVGGTAGSGRGGSAGSDAGGALGTGGGGTQATSDKLDVLLVIDNSVSMSDKQDVLDATLPAFMKRLTNPLCVDANHHPVTTQPSSISQPCSTGTREFTAHDFHLAVISTSLGFMAVRCARRPRRATSVLRRSMIAASCSANFARTSAPGRALVSCLGIRRA